MKKIFIKLLQDLAPILAGFQITVALVGSIGLGAIANWILIHWIPFTHMVWSNLLEFINLPDITSQEKDALTAVVFFLPMAISTIWIRSTSKSSQEIRIRIYATIVGFAFFAVIGQGVINDLTKILKGGLFITENITNTVSIAGLLSFVLTILNAYLTYKKIQEKVKGKEIDLKELLKNKIQIYQIYFLAPLFLMLFIAAIYVTPDLGFIRAFSPLFILISLFITVFINPSRLLTTFGVVLAFLGTSVIYDGVMYAISYVEISTNASL